MKVELIFALPQFGVGLPGQPLFTFSIKARKRCFEPVNHPLLPAR
jgi:hypothetical protein